jgi:hypothetical protein
MVSQNQRPQANLLLQISIHGTAQLRGAEKKQAASECRWLPDVSVVDESGTRKSLDHSYRQQQAEYVPHPQREPREQTSLRSVNYESVLFCGWFFFD